MPPIQIAAAARWITSNPIITARGLGAGVALDGEAGEGDEAGRTPRPSRGPAGRGRG